MKYDFIFYQTDCSFTYGDFPGATVQAHEDHGFSIEIDCNDNVNIKSIKSFGDYYRMASEIKTLNDLKRFVRKHIPDIEAIKNLSLEENIEYFKCILVVKDQI